MRLRLRMRDRSVREVMDRKGVGIDLGIGIGSGGSRRRSGLRCGARDVRERLAMFLLRRLLARRNPSSASSGTRRRLHGRLPPTRNTAIHFLRLRLNLAKFVRFDLDSRLGVDDPDAAHDPSEVIATDAAMARRQLTERVGLAPWSLTSSVRRRRRCRCRCGCGHVRRSRGSGRGGCRHFRVLLLQTRRQRRPMRRENVPGYRGTSEDILCRKSLRESEAAASAELDRKRDQVGLELRRLLLGDSKRRVLIRYVDDLLGGQRRWWPIPCKVGIDVAQRYRRPRSQDWRVVAVRDHSR